MQYMVGKYYDEKELEVELSRWGFTVRQDRGNLQGGRYVEMVNPETGKVVRVIMVDSVYPGYQRVVSVNIHERGWFG